jgi:hypothetical protein
VDCESRIGAVSVHAQGARDVPLCVGTRGCRRLAWRRSRSPLLVLDLELTLTAGARVEPRQTLIVESAAGVLPPVVPVVGARPEEGELGSA